MSRIAVIGGGQNGEHDVSLGSAAAAAAALGSVGHQIVSLTIARDGSWHENQLPIRLAAAVERLQECDVVVPMLHGRGGEDGTLAALCELAGVPYVGSPLIPSAIAMDKWVTKLVAADLGVAVAPGQLATAPIAAAYEYREPVVVKPVTAGSSCGVSLVTSAEELDDAFRQAFALDDRVLIEEVISGREVDIAVIRGFDGRLEVSPPLEIQNDGIFDYTAKYGGGAQFVIPAHISDAQLQQLQTAAAAIYQALGCRGVVRLDFFLTDAGVVFNEANTAPGFTETSQAPKMFAAAGMPYPVLLDRLVRDAVA